MDANVLKAHQDVVKHYQESWGDEYENAPEDLNDLLANITKLIDSHLYLAANAITIQERVSAFNKAKKVF